MVENPTTGETTALDNGSALTTIADMRTSRTPPNRIRQWRQRSGLTLDQLAELVGSTNQTIGRYERGERSVTIDVMLQLAPALGCKPADLLPDPGSILSEDELQLLRLCADLDPDDRLTLLRIARGLADDAGGPDGVLPRKRLRRKIR